LIGLIRTNASSQFADSTSQRFVRSWFNNKTTFVYAVQQANLSTNSAAFVELNTNMRAEWVCWAGEMVELSFTGATYSSTSVVAGINTSLGIDGTTPIEGAYGYRSTYADVNTQHVLARATAAPAEGYHYSTVLGQTDAGTGIWYRYGAAAGSRSTNQAIIYRGI
jgi:hypothetical protein